MIRTLPIKQVFILVAVAMLLGACGWAEWPPPDDEPRASNRPETSGPSSSAFINATAVTVGKGDTVYGLSGYISGSHDRAVEIARRIRTGNMHINGAGPDFNAPFGGYKQSGNGREWGSHGMDEFLEVKAILGGVAS